MLVQFMATLLTVAWEALIGHWYNQLLFQGGVDTTIYCAITYAIALFLINRMKDSTASARMSLRFLLLVIPAFIQALAWVGMVNPPLLK